MTDKLKGKGRKAEKQLGPSVRVKLSQGPGVEAGLRPRFFLRK